jgi:ribosomal protein S18 acetylase RimI-like enzyme
VSYTKSFSIWLGTSYVSIDDVFVQEGFRSQGTGRMLMHYMRQVARADGFRLIRWGVEKDNDQAIKFYKSLGAAYKEKGVCSWYL